MTSSLFTPLCREFYLPGAVVVARALLGKRLVHQSPEGTTAGIIVETEAYAGRDDAACHSYKRQAPSGNHRTNSMFAEGGHAYVYLIYGMYHCFNIVANVADEPEAVLIRAVEPVEGLALMAQRRGIEFSKSGSRSDDDLRGLVRESKKLCSGPGKLCIAMGITREHDGHDLFRNTPISKNSDHIFLTNGQIVADLDIVTTPRINVDYAGEAAAWPYRFVIRENEFLSSKK